jgi:ParB family transcriptional regulator, chromosome partitioning protein
MERGIRLLDLDRISPNMRLVCDADALDGICRSIDTQGQLEPIRVWFEHESFRILDGEKRWRACKRLRMKTIQAIIESDIG